MKSPVLITVIISVLLLSVASAFSAERVYEEGSVWSVTMVKCEANMQDEYIKDLAGAWKKIMDEAKAQGLILSYKVLTGSWANPDDWDVLLMAEFENFAALDDAYDQWEAVAEKVMGTEEKRLEASIEREKIRDIFGDKIMREIMIK